MRLFPAAALILLVSGLACAPPPAAEPPGHAELHAVMVAEDRRAGSDSELEVMRAGARSSDARVRAVAARGLGRLERAELVAELVALLEDEDAGVRRQAAFAIGQTADSGTVGEATMPLYLAVSRDPDDAVRATAAHALGRLPYGSDELIEDAWQALFSVTVAPGEGHGSGDAREASPEVVVGVVRGLEVLARRNRGRFEPPSEIVAWLGTLVRLPAGAPMGSRLRPLAVATLAAADRLDPETIAAGIDAPDTETRRLAAGALAGNSTSVLRAALSDDEPAVRIAALQALRSDPNRCTSGVAALGDGSPQVRLQALALLDGCPGATAPVRAMATAVADGSGDWQVGATALLTLARAGALDAQLLAMAAAHPVWQVRMYAARAADATAIAILEALAEDPVANTRHAAIERLATLVGHDADPYLVGALAADDPQLVMTAASLLEGSTSAGAVAGMASALQRFSDRPRMTDRDVRLALLERLGELGAEDSLLAAHLNDFDPAVAARAAEILAARTGAPVTAAARAVAGLPFPDLVELEQLAGGSFRVHMARGGSFTLRLLPFEAPTNAARFARMARRGAFDGLSFHRVVANFVIQGGSPGANEYAGHGEFTRDEITDRSHRRGTVGISTRGRDTGDGQIFVNLVDNYRLDGDYTIFAEVVEGMETVDAVLEGDVIARIETIERP